MISKNVRLSNKLNFLMLSFMLVLAVNEIGHAAGWSAGGSMVTDRVYHSATLLPDGRVLAAGGSGGDSSAELYDPALNTWSATGAMSTGRSGHSAALLADGRVLVVGGSGSSGTLSSAELYDPATSTWSAAGSLTTGRSKLSITLLSDGRVLVAGGWDASYNELSSVEIYDPATNSWSDVGSMTTARIHHSAALLPDGRVLVAGGHGDWYISSAELYDPSTKTWSAANSMADPREKFSATLLRNGLVLVAGGWSGAILTNSAELYDPTTNTWSSAGSLADTRAEHTATLLPDGRVLVTGGQGEGAESHASAELYDPATNSWSTAGSMAADRSKHSATLLADGRVLVAGGDFNSTELYNPAVGSWSAAGSMVTGRGSHSSALLADGRLLVVGGTGGGTLSSAELYNPSTDSWSATGSMSTARTGSNAILLADGRVLVTGGEGGSGYLASAERYDPATGSWSAAGSMSTGRFYPGSTLLADGRVLVAGGADSSYDGLSSAELYDPATNSWLAAGSMTYARKRSSATLLPDGRVLVAGDASGAELYNPTTNSWSAGGTMAIGRTAHGAILLLDGRVLVVGGDGGARASAELYDPATNSWSAAGSMVTGRGFIKPILLPDGRVLIAGGWDTSTLASAELYDPVTNSWSAAGSLSTGRLYPSATLLPDGRVLVAGGSGTSSADIYDPGLGFNNAWRPIIASAPSTITLKTAFSAITGSGFRGVGNTEASSGGYNSSATNYPLVRIKSAINEEIQWASLQSFTATNYTSGVFSDLTAGPAWMTVIVNGIPSLDKYVVIEKTTVPVSLGNLSQTYDGSGNVPTATTTPGSLTVDFTYNGSVTAPTTIGSYAVVGTVNDINYEGSASGTLVITKATVPVTLGSLSQTYDTSARVATATTTPGGLTVIFTYDGLVTAPTNVGTYAVVGTVNEVNYQGSASGTLVVNKATAPVSIGSLSQTYDGSARAATATTTPGGLMVDFTYEGSTTAPTNAGSYAVVGTVNEANYQGSASGTLVIDKATATVSLGSLSQGCSGTAKVATATTTPGGLTVDLTYDGSKTAPINVGSYAVVGTVNESNYQGSAGGTLTISPVVPAVTTLSPSDVTSITIQARGNVTFDGGVPVEWRGVCWNTVGMPTTMDGCMSPGAGGLMGAFTYIMDGLTPATTYYVRSMAVNSVGVSLGNEVVITTYPLRKLTVSKVGRGTGIVTSTPTGIDCGTDCEELYNDSTEVTLTTTPDEGFTFYHWYGDEDCKDGIVTLTSDVQCVAKFYSPFPWNVLQPILIYNTSRPLP